MRMHAVDNHMAYPFALGLGGQQMALASWFTGVVQVIARATSKTGGPDGQLEVT